MIALVSSELLTKDEIKIIATVNGPPDSNYRKIIAFSSSNSQQFRIPVEVESVEIPKDYADCIKEYLGLGPKAVKKNLGIIRTVVVGQILPLRMGDRIAFYTDTKLIKDKDLGFPGHPMRIVERIEVLNGNGKVAATYRCRF